MSKQYFENNPNLKNNKHKITLYYKQYLIDLISDSGVFSKSTVDYGTNALLRNLVIAPHVKNVLDMGCGYGVIGIAIAKDNPQAFVDMIDVNDRAITLTTTNLINNNITNAKAFSSFAFQNVGIMYDLIVTNPPIRAGKKVIYEMFEGAYEHLEEEGELWVVIRKAQGALSALDKIRSLFHNGEVIKKDKGYFIIMGKKRDKN